MRPDDWSPGKLLAGRYRILGVARAGGFGAVFEAFDSNLRTKVWVSGLGAPDSLRAEAQRAARAAATLDHAHLLHIDEVGDDEGTLFVRTRVVARPSLDERLQAGAALDVAEAARILLHVAEVLAHAHAQGVCHGDLQAGCILFDGEGRLLVADTAIAAAARESTWRGQDGVRADLLAFRRLARRLLGTEEVRAPLAEFVDENAALSSAADVAKRLRTVVFPRKKARGPFLAAVAAGAALAGLAVFLLLFGGDPPERDRSISLLLAQQRFDETIEELNRRRRESPDDLTLDLLLAATLRRRASQFAQEEAWWDAQRLAEQAEALQATTEGAALLEKVRNGARERLRTLELGVPLVTNRGSLRFELGGIPVELFKVGDHVVRIHEGAAEIDLPPRDGPVELAVYLRDAAGNERRIRLAFVLDRTAPELQVLEPKEEFAGASGRVRIRVRVRDAHLPAQFEIQGKSFALEKGAGEAVFDLKDGHHTLRIAITDQAGNLTTVERRIRIDSRAPVLELDSDHFVTKLGRTTLRGRVHPPDARLTVGGKEVELDPTDGSFAAPLQTESTQTVSVVATGPGGSTARRTVELRRDNTRPKVSLVYPRRDKDGGLLFGAAEIRRGHLSLPLLVDDESRVRLETEFGSVSSLIWTLPVSEGTQKAQIEAIDEAGNVTVLAIRAEGRARGPRLEVSCPLKSPTNAVEVALDVRCDAPISFNGKSVKPGAIRHALVEGANDLTVHAEDRYGNRARWERRIVLDRSAPKIQLDGGVARHVGRQTLRLVASEPLAWLKVRNEDVEPDGNQAFTVVDVREGRQKLLITAADLAGNTVKTSFQLVARNHILELDGESHVRVDLEGRMQWFTLECWVKGTTPKEPMAIAGKAEGGAFGLLWASAKWRRPSGFVYVEGTGYLRLPSKRPWSWSSWTHLALCYDGETARFFVNGKIQATAEREGALRRTTQPLLLGALTVDGDGLRKRFRGALDEVRLSSVARYDRNFKPQRFFMRDAHTVALFHFDTDAEDAIRDDSGRDHHGKTTGTPVLTRRIR